MKSKAMTVYLLLIRQLYHYAKLYHLRDSVKMRLKNESKRTIISERFTQTI
jgi:hypothetical protein